MPKISISHVGESGLPIVVIDDLAANPLQLRQSANSADYCDLGDFYPGKRAPVDPYYFNDIGTVLGGIFRKIFHYRGKLVVERSYYSIVSTPPASLTLAQCIPHIDSTDPHHFAMVHYLAEKDFGGTAFFRHRSTGLEAITPPSHREFLDKLEEEFGEHGAPTKGYITGNTDYFEMIGSVDFAFNRAVIYPGNLLHCSMTAGQESLPPEPLSGRLTIASFLLAR